jgi:hypothetical protein
MRPRSEKLTGQAAVRGGMLQAHLSFLGVSDPAAVIAPLVDAETARILARQILPTDWISLRSLIQVDRAIARHMKAGEETFPELGRHSARRSLGGVYKSFMSGEPHRFFADMSMLHTRFQNFGTSGYERKGENGGLMRIQGYTEFSPVFCASGLGYYEEALKMMKAKGPVRVKETTCQCSGDPACTYELSW